MLVSVYLTACKASADIEQGIDMAYDNPRNFRYLATMELRNLRLSSKMFIDICASIPLPDCGKFKYDYNMIPEITLKVVAFVGLSGIRPEMIHSGSHDDSHWL